MAEKLPMTGKTANELQATCAKEVNDRITDKKYESVTENKLYTNIVHE